LEQTYFRERPALPWKNGGGTTRHLAQDVETEGQPGWRLSLAEIDRDGPFSLFPGMRRHHVIVYGAGLTLRTRDLEITADPFCPVTFDGDTTFTAILADGPCKAVNLIFDPRLVAASLQVITTETWSAQGTHSLILCLRGGATLEEPEGRIVPGQFTWVRGSASIVPAPGAQLVCVAITDLR
jgi:uncharacterized protein